MSAILEVHVAYADKLVNDLRINFPTATTDRVENAIKTVAQRIYDDALRLVPVRTGFLRSTIGWDEEGNFSFKLFAKAIYAPYVEWGTSRMAPRLFMTRALEMHTIELLQEVQNAVAEAISDTFK
jgi:HK97 gp10 family phage protein